MYSKNDYRYYLEHQLMYSDNYLAHYGVIGMKWGVRHDERRASLVSKKDANNAKIANYQKKLNTVGAQKRAAKAAKYKAKQDKYDRKAARARTRLAQGKNLSKGEMRKISKAEKYRAKVAKNSKRNDKYQAKIAQLREKNTRLDRKISKMDKPSRAGARAYQKGLNSLDKKKARAIYKEHEGLTKKSRDKARKNLKSFEKEASATYKDAKKRGYDVNTSSVERWANPVESTAFAAATAALPTPIAYTRVVNVSGTKYKVRVPKKK